MMTGDYSPEQLEQATSYIDQLAERLVASVDQSVDERVQAHRDYLGGIVVYDSLICGPSDHAKDDFTPYDRLQAGQTIAERLNSRFFEHIAPAIEKHGIDLSGRLSRYNNFVHNKAEWRTISRLVGTNIFDADERPVGESYDVDILRRLAVGQIHVMLWDFKKR